MAGADCQTADGTDRAGAPPAGRAGGRAGRPGGPDGGYPDGGLRRLTLTGLRRLFFRFRSLRFRFF